MKFIPMMITIVLLLIIASGISCYMINKEVNEPTSIVLNVVEIPELDTDFTINCEEKINEEELAREELKKQIVLSWNKWYDDEQAPKEDKRRERFPELASYVVDYTTYYMNYETEHNGKLPKDNLIYFLVAAIAVKESAVDPNVVGSRGEVGVLQVMKTALRGYSSEEVRNNPELGIKLGISWLADQVPYCKWPENIDEMAGPLSIYAGGINRAKKNGKCLEFSLSKHRIALAKRFASWVTL